MDFTFLLITFILVVFLFISYLLDVIKLSSPLILIYLIFCFTYVIDSDGNQKTIGRIDKIRNNEDISLVPQVIDSLAIISQKIDNIDSAASDVSKPIVSFNPKPIIIDTNIVDQKVKDKSLLNISEAEFSSPDIKNENKEKYLEPVMLNEVMICRGVYKRNPIKPGFKFANNVDSLFCYTKISNKGSKQEIKHLWYYENKLITSVAYNIKTSYNYRSWSKKTILPNQTGQWRVDIVDNKERILGSRSFQIFSLNNAF